MLKLVEKWPVISRTAMEPLFNGHLEILLLHRKLLSLSEINFGSVRTTNLLFSSEVTCIRHCLNSENPLREVPDSIKSRFTYLVKEKVIFL